MKRAILALAAALSAASAPPGPQAIRLNQAGFAPEGPKRFAVVSPPADAEWSLTDERGRTVATGRVPPARLNAGSGEQVALIEIDRALPVGRYTLRVGNLEREVRVAERPNRALFADAMSFFYQQRAGTPILARWVQRPDLARAAGHAPEVAGCFAGTDLRGVKWPGCAARVDVTGGWYDAGDRGKYVVNAGISVWTLLDAYERLAGRNSPLARDSALALPEAGNGVPDLLDEVRYELEWMLRMQLPDGATATVADGGSGTRTIQAAGLVYHKVADTVWAPVPIRPADDHGVRALYPPSTAATLNLAAVAAQCARVWRGIDPAFAQRCLTASVRAYAAAERHPDLIADNRFTGSGGYGDAHLADEFFWAAAELAITTGEAEYVAALERSPLARRGPSGNLSWADVAMAGAIDLAARPGPVPDRLAAVQRSAVLRAAEGFVEGEADQTYRIPAAAGATEWGSNGALLDRAIVLGAAFDLTGDKRYRSAVTDAMDYVLGRNPLDRSFVSGYGDRPMQHPHHRFWAHQADPSYPFPPPGVLSGGPNSRTMTDDVARTMRGRCLPQLCWTDDYRAFTQNEVAINWNAPLVWVAAFLDGGS